MRTVSRMNNGNPRNIWTEDKGQVLDAVASIEGGDRLVPDETKVSETAVKQGVLCTSDCPYCSSQIKHIILWGEFAAYALGQPLPDTRATTGGVDYGAKCGGCHRKTTVRLTWPEVTKYVEDGVRRGALKPEILRTLYGK